MKERHLQETDSGYRVFLYIFYVCAFMMVSILVYGVYITMLEWQENGTYVMGEAIHNTGFPTKNFAKLSTWLFFSTIIGWYCVSRIGWKKTVGNKIVSWKMSLLQLMLVGFVIICLYEVMYNFMVLGAMISNGIVNGHVPDIDRLSIAYPDPNRPWNLVFATKVFLASLIISSHALYLSTKPRKSIDELDA